MSLSPGAKGWVSKYFELVQKQEIFIRSYHPKAIDIEHYLHLRLSRSGIVFGFADKLIFAKNLDSQTWTSNEKLRLLLFESLLLIYSVEKNQQPINREEFVQTVLDFYGKLNLYSISSMFTFFLKESKEERLEKILTKRTELKSNLLENTFWFNHLSNSFLYLDLVLFQEYLHTSTNLLESNYNEMAFTSLHAISLAANSDQVIDKQEKRIFETFLTASNLDDSEKEKAKELFLNPGKLTDIQIDTFHNCLFTRFILDISILTIYVNQDALEEEVEYLDELCHYLGLDPTELEENFAIVEHFILNKNQEIAYLSKHTSYERIYKTMTNRWVKVLSRNKDKLGRELSESKELVSLIKKSASHELTKEEKEKVKTQFLDIVKSMPALAIFMLPGGAILLPVILKILPDLVPSAFRDNEIDEN
jgi:hypothetical protein